MYLLMTLSAQQARVWQPPFSAFKPLLRWRWFSGGHAASLAGLSPLPIILSPGILKSLKGLYVLTAFSGAGADESTWDSRKSFDRVVDAWY
ncbi:uncharacterized protein N7515_009303 [Penicillium bovifimosum]|uniref:Uncharacterized protein n=1 Tax=Penicillium bovifimosum TaxID=126998 RepID=A0A9W9KVD4_9EURO|nr:uncharacterized protein N7515_009303 [Penicillium bovifimosum]KAJ5121342.1 hypothetical protein N7515_009303 [Penicillium bovifimosum]